MLPRKWKDSIVPLQWAEPRRRVPGRSHKHSLIIPSRAFDSRNTLKNKQPINLSFLVCLGIQSSNELAPWRSQTPHCTPSTVPPHSSAPPLYRRMQSVPAKALGSGGPDGSNEGCPGQTQGARNWKQRILVWPQEPPPTTCDFRLKRELCGDVTGWGGKVISLPLSEPSWQPQPGKGRPSFNCFPVLVTLVAGRAPAWVGFGCHSVETFLGDLPK